MTDLSERELDIVKLIVHGLTSKEIATALNITRPTVSFHITNIARKLGVTKKVEIAVRAVREGIA